MGGGGVKIDREKYSTVYEQDNPQAQGEKEKDPETGGKLKRRLEDKQKQEKHCFK